VPVPWEVTVLLSAVVNAQPDTGMRARGEFIVWRPAIHQNHLNFPESDNANVHVHATCRRRLLSESALSPDIEVVLPTKDCRSMSCQSCAMRCRSSPLIITDKRGV